MKTNETTTNKLLGALTCILVFFITTRPPVDADLWWHLRAGQSMWNQHQILLSDPFSYTRLGAPWVNAFWASEIVFYLLQKWGGYFAITIFVSLAAVATFYLIQRRLSGNPFVNFGVIILAAMTASPIWGPRPQIISFLFVALLDHWLASGLKHKWVLPILFTLWANIHGGWIWGVLLLVAHVTGLLVKLAYTKGDEAHTLWNDIRSLLGWSLITIFAIGFNPNGLAIWKLPFEQVHVSMQIQEWLSPDFHRLDFHPFLWMIFLLLLTSRFQSPSPDWTRIFKVLGFAYLTFVAQRNIALFAIVAAPLLAAWCNAALSALPERKRNSASVSLPPNFRMIFNSAILVAFGVVAAGYAYVLSRPLQVDNHYPIGAVRWMQNNKPVGRLFNSYNWGGYILWNLPDYPVFIDGRADLYGSKIISEWQSVASDQDNAMLILDQWDVSIVFIESSSPIIKTLKQNGWRLAFQDRTAAILLRE